MRCGWGPYFRRTFEVQAGNSPLQGQSKPPAKLVVLITLRIAVSPGIYHDTGRKTDDCSFHTIERKGEIGYD